MKILYFTATGNSLYVAKALGGEALSIPQMIKEDRYEFTDDKIGIVFPLYSWSMPPYVVEFIQKAKFHCDYLFGIATYGIYSAGVANHVLSIGEEVGHIFDYINRIRMVDNFLPTFKMDREIKNESKKEIEKHISEIKSDIEHSKKWILKENGFKKTSTNLMLRYGIHPFDVNKYSVTEECIACGTCAKVCPVDNIVVDKENKTITYKEPCIGCFACIQNCPQKAIHLKGEVDGSRFRNSHVTLNEIMEANK